MVYLWPIALTTAFVNEFYVKSLEEIGQKVYQLHYSICFKLNETESALIDLVS